MYRRTKDWISDTQVSSNWPPDSNMVSVVLKSNWTQGDMFGQTINRKALADTKYRECLTKCTLELDRTFFEAI